VVSLLWCALTGGIQEEIFRNGVLRELSNVFVLKAEISSWSIQQLSCGVDLARYVHPGGILQAVGSHDLGPELECTEGVEPLLEETHGFSLG
jgi:hypothetical protein